MAVAQSLEFAQQRILQLLSRYSDPYFQYRLLRPVSRNRLGSREYAYVERNGRPVQVVLVRFPLDQDQPYPTGGGLTYTGTYRGVVNYDVSVGDRLEQISTGKVYEVVERVERIPDVLVAVTLKEIEEDEDA